MFNLWPIKGISYHCVVNQCVDGVRGGRDRVDSIVIFINLILVRVLLDVPQVADFLVHRDVASPRHKPRKPLEREREISQRERGGKVMCITIHVHSNITIYTLTQASYVGTGHTLDHITQGRVR